jgi:hypothetical protein
MTTVLFVSVDVLDAFCDGNCVVLLPAESTLTAFEFAELVQAEARDPGLIAPAEGADPITKVDVVVDVVVVAVVVGAVELDGDLSN